MSTHTGFKLDSSGYGSLKRKLSDHDARLLSMTFHEADAENKGFLSREDLKVAMVMLFGYKPSKYEVDRLLQDHENSPGLTLEQFMVVVGPKIFAIDEDAEIRQSFMAFDAHCRGFLTLEDAKRVFSEVAPNLPVHTTETAFRELDRDGDGRISYKDFEFMMKFDSEDS